MTKKVQKEWFWRLIIRMGLFILVLSLGTLVFLAMNGSAGLALIDLSRASVRALVGPASGGTLYAAMSIGSQPDGIYRSDDGGRSWQFIGAGPGVTIDALAVHPAHEAVLYVGAAGGPASAANNLWRSQDGGQTWRRLFLNLPAQPDGLVPAVTALAIDSGPSAVLYIGTNGQGVYRLEVGPDGSGASLLDRGSLAGTHINGLVAGRDGQMYALTNRGLFVTADRGWQQLEAPEIPISLATAPTAPQILYAGAPSSGVYRSDDGGQSWARIGGDWWLIPGATLRGTALAVDEQAADHVAVATAYQVGNRMVGGGIYETHNAGQSWVKLADANGVVTQLAINKEAIYAATPNGLIRYGQPVEPGLAIPFTGLSSPVRLTTLQILVLVLTLALAGLILLGRAEWVIRSRGHTGPFE